MSCCCSSAASKKERQDCPECGKPCLPVIKQAILHQVQFPNNQSIAEGDYAFCANRGCATGYFSASTMIPKSTLRTFRTGAEAMLCYCFDISEATYRTALGDGTAQAMKAFVCPTDERGRVRL